MWSFLLTVCGGKSGALLACVCTILLLMVGVQTYRVSSLEGECKEKQTIIDELINRIKVSEKNNSILKDTVMLNDKKCQEGLTELRASLQVEQESCQAQLAREKERYEVLLESRDVLPSKSGAVADEKTTAKYRQSINHFIDSWNARSSGM